MVAAMGILPGAPTRFEDCRDVSFGGVLCTLPALAANGLFEHFEETFPSLGGYYTTLQVVTLLAYMALCRIKTVEQLQYETPGELGKLMGLDRVLEVRCLRKKLTRLFDEKKNGAGALMDYCCYGANLAVVLMGMPRDVLGITGRLVKRDILVEDNAMVVMDYPSGVAVAEASRTQIGKLTGYITALYGTRATLMVEPRAGGRLWLATPDQSEGAEVDVPTPSPQMADPAAHLAWAVASGGPFWHLGHLENCLAAQEILEAALISSRSGQRATLPLEN